jgi:hypothetical protein
MWADSVVLKPAADTAIFSLGATSNFGKESALPLGAVGNNAAGNVGRMLMRFDLSNVPTNAVITNVTLRVTVTKQRNGGAAEPIELHRLLKNWGEGSKVGLQGAVATSGEATWRDRFASQTAAWGVAGGQAGTDFTTTASVTNNLGGPANYTFPTTPALVADVQAWLQDPTANFGWLLLSAKENVVGSAKRVASHEDATRSPLLTIGFSVPPPPPPPPKFDRITRKGDTVELGFHAEAGSIYTVSFRPAADAGVWQSLTNVVSKLVSVEAVVTDTLAESSRFYQVAITGHVD